MADLGNLYFDILFRDKTAEQRKKLKAEITKDLQAKLDVGFDKKKLVGDMKTLLQSEKFKINVVVDKASTTQAVRAALQAAGLNTNLQQVIYAPPKPQPFKPKRRLLPQLHVSLRDKEPPVPPKRNWIWLMPVRESANAARRT